MPFPRGEQDVVDRIRRAMPAHAGVTAGLALGIGDDAAVLRTPRQADWVLSCDLFLENEHFLANVQPPEAVGYKSLARAASDLGAMGAAPRFFLLSLALPAPRTGRWLDRFLAGMSRAARKFELILIGGDTARHATVAVSISVVGEVPRGRAVTRAGARPGDWVYISGTVGAAQLGLELIRRRLHRRQNFRRLLRAHFYPEPRLRLGQWLSRRGLASAMIDTSDGLSTDLDHIAQASGVGVRLWRNRIPAVPVPGELRARGIRAGELALHGGEDYELLFTVPRRLGRRLPASYGGVRLTRIGEITREKGLWLIDAQGHAAPLAIRGWDHFRPR